jgi:hypothetical protein
MLVLDNFYYSWVLHSKKYNKNHNHNKVFKKLNLLGVRQPRALCWG